MVQVSVSVVADAEFVFEGCTLLTFFEIHIPHTTREPHEKNVCSSIPVVESVCVCTIRYMINSLHCSTVKEACPYIKYLKEN